MYQALYRKYRPQNLNEVVGQEIVIKTLKNAIENNKISHAYLFTGPRGTGKTSIAKILARTVNCESIKECIPCNKCVNCTQTNSGESIDIIEIDAASNNGIDEIREIRNKVSLVPTYGKYKIYIIDEVHMLTTGAFNALLKTLEEPPSHIIFILATTEPHKIPATILSRCQRFDFKRIPTNLIVKRLKYISDTEKIDITDEAIDEIAKICDGGMRDAISLLDEVVAYSSTPSIDDVNEINGSISQSKLENFVFCIINHDIENILKNIDELYNNGKSIIKVTEELLTYFKNILLYKVSPEYLKSITNNYGDYEKFSKNISQEILIKLLNRLNTSLNTIKTSSDPKLAMELMLIDECNSIQSDIQKNESESIANTSLLKPVEKKKTDINSLVIEKKEEPKGNEEEIGEQIEDSYIEIKKIRINNTLSKFDKANLKRIKQLFGRVNEYLLDDRFGKYASLLLDSEIKASSNEYLIFVFDSSMLSHEFNSSILVIEEFLTLLFNEKYKIISVNKEEWEIIKNEFNSKKKIYKYTEEKELDFLKKTVSNTKIIKNSFIDEQFNELIEYK